VPDEDLLANPQLDAARPGVALFAVPHHLAHASAVYALSGKEESSVLVMDGSGSFWSDLPVAERDAVPEAQRARALRHASAGWQPRECASIYSVHRGDFTPVEKHISLNSTTFHSVGMAPFASLGNMYAAVGLQIFGDFLDGPGKVMGLAPYGRATIPVEEFFRVTEWGFEFQSAAIKRFQHRDRWPQRQAEYRDLAASVQKAIEEGVLVLCQRLRRKCPDLHVCYAGGVALNSVANERIVREAGFDDLFIMPAAEDSGTSLGAAYYALWQLTGYRPSARQQTDSVGRRYSRQEISQAICSAPGVSGTTPSQLVEETCELLADGKIVGWFQEGSELGPRALGQRSILCDPRPADMKDRINERVKFREGFRPFAPMILAEDVREWFEVPPGQEQSPFMLRVMPFRPGQARRVPAVAHVDGTGRVQTVTREATPLLHALLTAWKKVSGVPILLNTSMNIAGEPIVETPDDAIWCLTYTQMDACVLGDHLVTKTMDEEGLMRCVLRLNSHCFGLYNAANQPDPSIPIPELTSAGDYIRSAHVSRADQLAERLAVNHLRITVRSSWGEVAHGASPALIRILELVDDRRSAGEIFMLLASPNGSPDYSLARFKRHLGLLRRAGVIQFSQAG
jgi:carbamoyltransferase